MNLDKTPRDGGFTQEEIDLKLPYENYDIWLSWWVDLLNKQQTT